VVGESFGHVTKIGVRAVSIVTRDGKEHLIPNENLMTQEVENWSYSNTNVRIHIPVGVSYSCDLALGAEADDRCSDGPVALFLKPHALPSGFARSATARSIMKSWCWIRDRKREWAMSSPRSSTGSGCCSRRIGSKFPFPQRDINVKEWPPLPQASKGEGAPTAG
jgi:hypothetical protein